MLAGTLTLVFSSFMLIHGLQLRNKEVVMLQTLHGSQRSQPPDLCSDPSFDAIFEYPAQGIYVLKGEYYWRLARDGIASGYPHLISHFWPGLPSDIDAATAASNGLTYFFKGNKYWTFDWTFPHFCSPSYISVGWPGIPDDVNGATWAGHSIFYFFKGDLYWKYDSSQFPEVPALYPKPVAEWGSIEGHVEDVLYVNSGYIYFFTNGSYYRYNCVTARIDYGHPNQPNYPRPTSWWFQCNEKVAEGNVSSSEPATTVTTTVPITINTSTASSTTTIPATINTTVSPTTIGTTVISTIYSNVTTTSSDTETDYDIPSAAQVLDYSGDEVARGHASWRTKTACPVSFTLLAVLVVSLAFSAAA